MSFLNNEKNEDYKVKRNKPLYILERGVMKKKPPCKQWLCSTFFNFKP
jgi:hypothetical protein